MYIIYIYVIVYEPLEYEPLKMNFFWPPPNFSNSSDQFLCPNAEFCRS